MRKLGRNAKHLPQLRVGRIRWLGQNQGMWFGIELEHDL
jgi:hypothetical protein